MSCGGSERTVSTPEQNRSADEAAIRALLVENQTAFNRQDAAGVAATYTPDEDIWIVDGPQGSRADEIRRLEEDFYRTSGFREGKITNDTMRFVRPDVALVETTATTTLDAGERRSQATFVVVCRGGAWKIAARHEEGRTARMRLYPETFDCRGASDRVARR